MTRPIDLEDLCVWPDGSYCAFEDLEDMLTMHSDDFEILPYDSFRAAYITGALESECLALFGHEYWQVLNDENATKLLAHLGVRELEPCGYCNPKTSDNPNDMCKSCWDNMQEGA